jgi:hypothetical protein
VRVAPLGSSRDGLGPEVGHRLRRCRSRRCGGRAGCRTTGPAEVSPGTRSRDKTWSGSVEPACPLPDVILVLVTHRVDLGVSSSSRVTRSDVDPSFFGRGGDTRLRRCHGAGDADVTNVTGVTGGGAMGEQAQKPAADGRASRTTWYPHGSVTTETTAVHAPVAAYRHTRTRPRDVTAVGHKLPDDSGGPGGGEGVPLSAPSNAFPSTGAVPDVAGSHTGDRGAPLPSHPPMT